MNTVNTVSFQIEPMSDQHRSWVRTRTQTLFNGTFVVIRGKTYEPASLQGFIALDRSVPMGLATYYIENDVCEIVTLDALAQWSGIGTALLSRVEEEAKMRQCKRARMITTNDNIDALRFYQKRAYHICAVHLNALER